MWTGRAKEEREDDRREALPKGGTAATSAVATRVAAASRPAVQELMQPTGATRGTAGLSSQSANFPNAALRSALLLLGPPLITFPPEDTRYANQRPRDLYALSGVFLFFCVCVSGHSYALRKVMVSPVLSLRERRGTFVVRGIEWSVEHAFSDTFRICSNGKRRTRDIW